MYQFSFQVEPQRGIFILHQTKCPLEQPRIVKEVLNNCRYNEDVCKLVKGFMIESYIKDGAQKIDEHIYGKSITDSCLGWNKTERLIYEMAELL